MQHAVLVAICQPFKQLLHVTLNLRRRESCARIGQPREIVVAELHDHVDRPLAVVVLACCDREVRGQLQRGYPANNPTPRIRQATAPPPPLSPPLGQKRTFGRHNLLQLHDVFVVQHLENLDLPDRRHGELRPQDSRQVRPCVAAHRPPSAPHPKQRWAPSAAHPFLLVVHTHPLQSHDLPRHLIPGLVHLPAQVRGGGAALQPTATLCLRFCGRCRTRTSPPPPAPPSRRPRRCESRPRCRPCPPPAYPVHYPQRLPPSQALRAEACQGPPLSESRATTGNAGGGEDEAPRSRTLVGCV